MSIKWNAAKSLWVENLVDGFKKKLETCAKGINSSGLASVEKIVFDYLPLVFTGKNRIAIDVSNIEKEQIADEGTEGIKYKTTVTFILRIYHGNIANLGNEIETQRTLVNLIDNYITELDVLQNGSTWPQWREFITGRIAYAVGWIGGGYGAEMQITCNTIDINYKKV